MATTRTENLIRHKRTRSGILVPMIEDFMRRPVNIEDEDDIAFLTKLQIKMLVREQERANGTAVYSPSQLASCLRYVYLLRHGRQMKIPRIAPARVEPHFYFLNGNFLHMKWQFVIFKMLKAGAVGIEPLELDNVEPRWCEGRVISKRKDHGGTVDIGLKILGEPMFVDVKGINVRTFGEITLGNVPPTYSMQLGDYMVLWNSKPGNDEKVRRSILLAENKGGPTPKFPLALHETIIEAQEQKPEIRRRLELLREYEAEEEIPGPECTGTRTFQFVGCPFQKFCKEEVKEIQQRREAADRKTTYKIARPKRTRKGK